MRIRHNIHMWTIHVFCVYAFWWLMASPTNQRNAYTYDCVCVCVLYAFWLFVQMLKSAPRAFAIIANTDQAISGAHRRWPICSVTKANKRTPQIIITFIYWVVVANVDVVVSSVNNTIRPAQRHTISAYTLALKYTSTDLFCVCGILCHLRTFHHAPSAQRYMCGKHIVYICIHLYRDTEIDLPQIIVSALINVCNVFAMRLPCDNQQANSNIRAANRTTLTYYI